MLEEKKEGGLQDPDFQKTLHLLGIGGGGGGGVGGQKGRKKGNLGE